MPIGEYDNPTVFPELLCLQHSRAFLLFSFTPFYIPPTNQFQCPYTTWSSLSDHFLTHRDQFPVLVPFSLLGRNTWQKEFKKIRVYFGSYFQCIAHHKGEIVAAETWGTDDSVLTVRKLRHLNANVQVIRPETPAMGRWHLYCWVGVAFVFLLNFPGIAVKIFTKEGLPSIPKPSVTDNGR